MNNDIPRDNKTKSLALMEILNCNWITNEDIQVEDNKMKLLSQMGFCILNDQYFDNGRMMLSFKVLLFSFPLSISLGK